MSQDPSHTDARQDPPTEVPPTEVPPDARSGSGAPARPRSGVGLARIYLALNGTIWALLGLYGILAPDDLADWVDYDLTTALARLEFRAMYGGLCVAVGFLHFLGFRPRWIALATGASVVLVGGLLAGRIVSLVVDGFAGLTAALLVGGELAIGVLGLLALLRLARDARRARRAASSP